MLIKILAVATVLVVVFAIVVAMRPSHFRVVRSATMAAPAAAVFEQVNDFHKWVAWSPWEQLDPELKRTYAGAPRGEGATYAWSGNNKVGEGRMTLTESRPAERIRLRLEFIRPFAAIHAGEFTFEPRGSSEQTAVTWSMEGNNSFLCKAFGLFVNMDKMVGDDFEKGLAQLKAKLESDRDGELAAASAGGAVISAAHAPALAAAAAH